MTIKQAKGVAKKWLGAKGVAKMVKHSPKQCVLGYACEHGGFDVRGHGRTFPEAVADLLNRETANRNDRTARRDRRNASK
jgi:hypothetical protein